MNILLEITSVDVDTTVVKDSVSAGSYLLETGRDLVNLFQETTNERFSGELIDHTENIWQFSLLLTCIIILALVRGLYTNRMSLFSEAVLIPRHMKQIMREESFLIHPFSLLLFFNTIVIYSLIAYKSMEYFNWVKSSESGFKLYVILFISVFVLLFTKVIVLKLMEFLTDTDQGQKENRYSWLLYHQFVGLLLILPTGVLLFGKETLVYPMLLLVYFLIIIFLVFRIGKAIFLAIGNNVYVLHLFLYLCALEIIPLIVLIKVLVNQISWLTEI